MDNATETELVERARSGDRAALEELLVRNQDRIYRFGVRMCGDPEQAKDVLQETLLAMARSVGDFRGASSLSTWLYTIARRFCLRSRRASKFAPREVLSFETGAGGDAVRAPSDAPGPDEAAADRQLQGELSAAILALPPEQREVLVLRDVEGLKASEVAEVLEVSVAAVKSRLHRARLAVREAVAGVVGDEETAPAFGCPEVLSMYSRHLEGEIGPELCADMERHLEGCARCRGACDSLKRTLSLCRASTERESVPDEVQEAVRTSLRKLLDA